VLIDFGSARGAIACHSRTISALVKPGYSPYEQYATTGANQGPWTDIYALGATLYHAITGKRPPDAPSRVVSDDYVPAPAAARGSYRSTFLDASPSGAARCLPPLPYASRNPPPLRGRSRAPWAGCARVRPRIPQPARRLDRARRTFPILPYRRA
jgi:serine/threonine protein kinase